MDEFYISDVLVEKGVAYSPQIAAGGKIKLHGPGYNRTVNIFIALACLLSLASLFSLKIDWMKLITRVGDLGKVFADLSRFSFVNFGMVAEAFAVSVSVTLLATVYGIIIGMFFGAFMARNITPSKKLAGLLSAFCSFIRAVPTPVWVLMMLACLGFGPAPGILGLTFHAAAFFGRAFSQAFEEVPQSSVEALQATGANRMQIFFSAILPASITALIAWGAMRFEINFGESAILGMVGGGGIGYSIAASMSSYKFGRAGISILMVFVFAYALELSFTALKRRMKV